MVCAIILAAGRSRRMGVQKLLLPFGGRTVIGHIAEQIIRGHIAQTIAVVCQDAAAVRQALSGLGVAFVVNPDPDGDMLSSVRCGLRAMPPDAEALLVALGDQPAITAELVQQMVRAYRPAAGGGIVVPVHGGRRGHPILFSAAYRQEILTGYDQVGLRGLLQAHPQDVLELPAGSPSVLADMDCPEDYSRELARFLADRSGPSD